MAVRREEDKGRKCVWFSAQNDKNEVNLIFSFCPLLGAPCFTLFFSLGNAKASTPSETIHLKIVTKQVRFEMVFIHITWNCFKYYIPLLCSLVFFLILFYTNAVVTTIADRIAPYYQPALPDIGHKILPYWYYYQVNNYWIIIAYVFIFIRFLPQADIRVTVFRRWFFVQGLMFGMRSISIYVTSLTVPQPGCVTNVTSLATPAVEAFYVIAGIHATCGDVLFSGHTVARKISF